MVTLLPFLPLWYFSVLHFLLCSAAESRQLIERNAIHRSLKMARLDENKVVVGFSTLLHSARGVSTMFH
jgi:hypothetical protein